MSVNADYPRRATGCLPELTDWDRYDRLGGDGRKQTGRSGRMFSLSVIRYQGPMLPDLNEGERRLYYRRCDTFARLWLNNMIMPEFDAGNFEGCSKLVHAERYLADRLAYELAPWPKRRIKLETEQDYELPQPAAER